MNHNLSAVIAIDPRAVNDSVYQKTLAVNDFYLGDGRGGPPLGNIQLLGRVSGAVLKGDLKSIEGSWAFEDLGDGGTRATYSMTVDLGRILGAVFRGPIVGILRGQLIESMPGKLKRDIEG